MLRRRRARGRLKSGRPDLRMLIDAVRECLVAGLALKVFIR
jgi:hypothetical protein